MKIKGINFIKISTFILTTILLINMILNINNSYQNYGGNVESGLVFFMTILGTVLGLIVRSGLTVLFWWSYNVKYPNEKFNQRIGKKIVVSLLFIMLMSGLSLGDGMLLVFIIWTQIMVLIEQKKDGLENDNNITYNLK